jgi:hypothetical protein
MAFTYNDTLATDRDMIRIRVGDTAQNNGPRPDGANFSDEEIAGLLSSEGSANRAIAAIYEILAAQWAGYADTQMGDRRESLSQVADRYTKLATQYRSEHGYAASVGFATGFVTRNDGYSQDIDASGDG